METNLVGRTCRISSINPDKDYLLNARCEIVGVVKEQQYIFAYVRVLNCVDNKAISKLAGRVYRIAVIDLRVEGFPPLGGGK